MSYHPERPNVVDDEDYARRLQYEEQSRMMGRGSSSSSNRKNGEPTTQRRQELRDYELAQEVVRLDFLEGQQQQKMQQPFVNLKNDRQASMGSVVESLVSTSTSRVSSDESRLSADLYASSAWKDHATGLPHQNQYSSGRQDNDFLSMESLEYARRLQEKAFSELEHRQQERVLPPLHHQTMEESDHDMALKMQEMEYVRMGRTAGLEGSSWDADSKGHNSFGHASFRSFASSRGSEDDDEKLARFMEESGTSIRDLSETDISDLLAVEPEPRDSFGSPTTASSAAVSNRFVPAPAWTNGSRASVAGLDSHPRSPGRPLPRETMQPLAQSAPTTPTHVTQYQAAGPSVASIPVLSPLSADSNAAQPKGKKRGKIRNLLGFGGKSDKLPPASPKLKALPRSLPTTPERHIPRGIPPPPGGSLSMGPPIAPLPFSRGRPVSNHSPSSSTRAHTSQDARADDKSWLQTSPYKAAKQTVGRGVLPLDGNRTKKGPLPHSVSVKSPAATPNLSHAGFEVYGRETPVCSVCNRSGGSLLHALNKKFHVDCFRCVACYERIDHSSPFAFNCDERGEMLPYHRSCYSATYGIRCSVCRNSIPPTDDGAISFVKHPFFDSERMCPRHAQSPSRRCTGCHRFEPHGDPFADLHDADRCLCYACCRTVVVDSNDVEPLWNEVLSFFENTLKLPVWKEMKEIAILSVQSDALNDVMERENSAHKGSSQIMTRGLCLTEFELGRRLKLPSMRFEKSSSSFEALDAELRGFTYFDLPGECCANPDTNVFAILCLSGLPRDLTSSILAHEATHAWMKLHPDYSSRRPLPPQVEEGCAQLVAMLLLSDGLPPADTVEDNGPSDERLRQYFKFSIERDDNEIYGAGYRKAAMAYSEIGIEALLSHCVRYGEFPNT